MQAVQNWSHNLTHQTYYSNIVSLHFSLFLDLIVTLWPEISLNIYLLSL